MKKAGRNSLNQVIKVNITNHETNWPTSHASWLTALRRLHYHLQNILATNTDFNLTKRKQSRNSKMRDSHNNLPDFFLSTTSERKCVLCLSESGLLHLTWYPSIASIYLQTTCCHYSLWLSKTSLCIYTTFSFDPFISCRASGLFP
jgi:hypothetical protein